MSLNGTKNIAAFQGNVATERGYPKYYAMNVITFNLVILSRRRR